MTPLESLRAKIIEANPSILDLVMGCEVQLDEQKGIFIMENPLVCSQCTCTTGVHIRLFSEGGKMCPQSFCKHKFNEWFEIIGRPIRLLDIKIWLLYNGYTINHFMEIAELWNNQDNLDEQSKELIEKLYGFTNKNG